MTRDEILEVVKKTIVDVTGDFLEDLSDTSDLKNDLGVDSLDMVEIGMKLEVHFNISIPDQIVEEASTPDDFVKYLELHVK